MITSKHKNQSTSTIL